MPSITITASKNNICAGTQVTFTAKPVDGGSSPRYQWQVNGINAGNNSITFTSSTLANGDKVTCTLISNATCATPANATSNSITMSINTNVTASVSIMALENNVCDGTLVNFNATPVNGGAAPVYQWQVNGVNTGTNNSTFGSNTFANGDKVTCLMTSNATCAIPMVATSNVVTMIVNPHLTPSVSIAASANNICAGDMIIFTATPVNGGTSPGYQWRINGVNMGVNSATFSSTTLTNGDVLSCVLSSNGTCITRPTANSNSISVNVNAAVAPSVIITASGNNICAGTPVTFTAKPVNGGNSPVYQWQLDGVNAGTNSLTFSSSDLANGDKITCIITSSANCVIPANASSNSIIMSINANATASVSISASQNSICEGSPVNFTATPVNGGSAPVYQWQVNGVNAGTNSVTFSSSNLANGDKVTCAMTSNATCATPIVATSNVVTMIVNPNLTPSVSIAASANNVCAGDMITFTATPVNGGASPTYQWRVNGVNVGTNSATFASTTLANGDVVNCFLTSNGTCTTTPTATSNSISVNVSATFAPSITITASTNNICAGNEATFTAKPLNEGTSPNYQWQLNGVNVGTNSITFSSSTLANGDVVTCIMTSSVACATPTAATSNSITMNINANLTASVSISASQNSICEGSPVNFTATPVNGGSAPVYQWQVNGVNAGTNNVTFSSSNLANGDKITCAMTSNATCATPIVATSNVVVININSPVMPLVSIAASANNICAGDLITFTATPVNGGPSPTYQWRVNGVNAGTNSATFSSTTLANGDMVNCVLTSNGTCNTTPTATSNSISVNVSSTVAPSVTITASGNNICAGSPVTFTAISKNGGDSPVYQWLVNGNKTGTNSDTFVSSDLANNDRISCQLTSNANCAVPAITGSNTITTVINPIPMVDGGGNKTIELGNSIRLMATASGSIADISWSPGTGLDNAKTLTPTAKPGKTTVYTVTVQSTDGCIASGTVTVTVLEDINIPNTFTPNGDGVNDKWNIKNLVDYPDCSVKIFDRWGQQVFASKGYGNAWDGTLGGKLLPFGTYYYVINLNNNTPPLGGFVAIIR